MADSPVLLEARFDQKVCDYWLLTGVLTLLFTVVMIPLLLVWFPLGRVLTRRYLERMSCVLTESKLHFKKGYFVRVEKTVPLDRITDLGIVQGPIMRKFGVSRLTVETAGQSQTGGALLSMTGIIDARAYRERVLEARDALLAGKPAPGGGDSEAPVEGELSGTAGSTTTQLLTDVKDSLGRIEGLLRDRDSR